MMAGFSRFLFKRYRWLILFVMFVVLPIVSLLNLGALFFYRRQKVFFAVSNYFVHDTTTITKASFDQRPASNIEYKAGEILTGRVRKYSYFSGELNSSQHRQFDSGVLNFSYVYDQIDMDEIFTKEFAGYDSLPTMNKTITYPGGYIFPLSIGQELSQCTIHLLELCLYAATSHRKVVTPRMINGGMRIGGLPFGEFFDVPRLNKQLLRFGYAELASEDEFQMNCEKQRKKVLVLFYDKPKAKGAPVIFHAAFRDKIDMYEKVKKAGWLNCTQYVNEIPPVFEKDRNNADYYCMDGTLFGNVELVNTKIFGDSKCIFISSWQQLYNVHWNRLLPTGAPYVFKFLYWFLDPSREVRDEASAFRDMRIQRPCVAIHIRGAKFKNHSFVEPCFDVALEFVNALRRARKVKTLFLSTDMSPFGGLTNKDKTSHQLFAEKSGAVIYDPNVAKRILKRIDRWKVSLTEVRLLTQSDHLITIGAGSFSNYIRNRYLWEHRNKQNWTLSVLCKSTVKRYF